MYNEPVTRRPNEATAYHINHQENIKEIALLLDRWGYATKVVQDGRALLFSSDSAPVEMIRIGDIVVEEKFTIFVMTEQEKNELYLTYAERAEVVESCAQELGVSESSLDAFLDLCYCRW